MNKLKKSTQFTLFATGLILAVMSIMFIVLISDMNAYLREHGLAENRFGILNANHILLFVSAAIVMFAVSSIIIDNVLNPVRQMISKVNELGQMKFKTPLVIDASDDELREYAIAFNVMSEKLNRYIKMQNQFVSDASHELATPITVINGHADMLLRRGRENPEILESGLITIKTEIMRMSGLVDSLLLLAKSDGGRQSYTFEPVDIPALIHDSIEEIKLIAPSSTFEINTDSLPIGSKTRCDEYAIRRVMRILLTNSIKYAQKITISATLSHGLLTISVKDNGIGIPPEHLPRIFERFYRVDTSRNKKTGSSGLGLAIAKEIIQSHGGEIKAESIFNMASNTDAKAARASGEESGTEIIFTISS